MGPTLRSYLETALWSSVDDDGNPLDRCYSIKDIADESLQKARLDVMAFLRLTIGLLDDVDADAPIGHDFWLTRNHHGAGFWDGHYSKELGQKLTALAHTFGECYMYVGDDSKIYID